jgi:hypothetical protein
MYKQLKTFNYCTTKEWSNYGVFLCKLNPLKETLRPRNPRMVKTITFQDMPLHRFRIILMIGRDSRLTYILQKYSLPADITQTLPRYFVSQRGKHNKLRLKASLYKV